MVHTQNQPVMYERGDCELSQQESLGPQGTGNTVMNMENPLAFLCDDERNFS